MAYEIVMPQLSDSMDEGKLISWKVKEGDFVKKGDVIAEVESDKAIMEVQSFKEGIVKSIQATEGDTVPVGGVIATIATDTQTREEHPPSAPQPEPKQTPQTVDKASTVQKTAETEKKQSSFLDEILGLDKEEKSISVTPTVEGDASPKAKAVAAAYNLDIEALQKEGKLPRPSHEKDVKEYHLKRYFTPKALELLKRYKLDSSLFEADKKHDSEEILFYIQKHDIPLPRPLSPFQKALVSSVEKSAQKPVYHLYDSIDTSELLTHKKHSVSVWLIKLFAKAMMMHENFRTIFKENTLITYPNASVSLAIAHDDLLYMPVFKDANLLSTQEIQEKLGEFETKAQEGKMSSSDMQGSTFGISNLGMLGIERFDAMINQDDSGIAAIGAAVNGTMSITLTLDHRVINGYQAAEFMQTLKTLALDPLNFKE